MYTYKACVGYIIFKAKSACHAAALYLTSVVIAVALLTRC